MSDSSVDQVLADFAGQGFGSFKPALGEVLIESLRPISERFLALKGDDSAIDAILIKGAERAASLAAPTVARAYDAMGLCR
jgi:tryptophanyl-tRNA synthetase